MSPNGVSQKLYNEKRQTKRLLPQVNRFESEKRFGQLFVFARTELNLRLAYEVQISLNSSSVACFVLLNQLSRPI